MDQLLDSLSRILPAALLLVLYLLPSTRAFGQVSVAPTALFLSEQERFGAIYVSNRSTAPQEVTVGFRFGYPEGDSLGRVSMQYEDSTMATARSVDPYVRAFPQQFVLPPGETQVVRLTARVPRDRQEGVYWTRVVTTSAPQVPFEDTTTTGIQTRVLFRLQQVTALFYEKGTPQASLDVEELTVDADSTGYDLLARIEHTGGAPFLGTALLRVLDAVGAEVASGQQSIALYVSDRRRFDLPLPEDAQGPFTAELTLTPERSDIPPEQILSIAPVTVRTTFRAR